LCDFQNGQMSPKKVDDRPASTTSPTQEGCSWMFRGIVSDYFVMPGKGLIVMLTEVEGMPKIGSVVDFLGGHLTILEVAKNSTDGQFVSTRDCLTGQPVAPYSTIVLKWPADRPAPDGVRGAELAEVALL
ncbi:MAG: hypothetical protein AAGP08_08850, partial [Pseudomonadota bacterium]